MALPLTPYIAHLLTLSFSTSALVPFFSPPSLIMLGYLVAVVIFKVLFRDIKYDRKITIFLIYICLTFLLVIWDLFLYGSMEIWYGYLFASFAVYTVVFMLIFDDLGDIVKTTRIFAYVLIVFSFLATSFELIQLFYMNVSYDSLLNKAAAHYRTADIVYFYRPLGLFGNYTVNAIAAIFAFSVIVYIEDNVLVREYSRKHQFVKYLMVIMVLGIVLVSQSGLGYMVFLAYIFCYIFRNTGNVAAIFFSMLAGALPFIFLSDYLGIQKTGTANIIYNFNILFDGLTMFHDLGPVELLMGSAPRRNMGYIDTSITVVLLKSGLVGLVTFSMMIYFVLNLSKGAAAVPVLVLIMGSLHYPVLGNQAVALLFAMLISIQLKRFSVPLIEGNNLD